MPIVYGRKQQVEVRRKELLASFANYDLTVILICSLEAWFEYRWGTSGVESRGELIAFNRFPSINGRTPDFTVSFRTPYFIVGEYQKTFRVGTAGRKDCEQVLAYAHHVEGAPNGTKVPHDVVVIVSIENDDIAAEEIANAIAALPAEQCPIARIIVLGAQLDGNGANGEWFKFKWRKHNNSKFHSPNISDKIAVKDLNELFANKLGHNAIPVNRPAADLTGRVPLVNDPPPPLFSAVRLLLPAINELLTPSERDTLQLTGRIEKVFTRDDLMATQKMQQISPSPPHLEQCIQEALDFLVCKTKSAKRLKETSPAKYAFVIDGSIKKDPKKWWANQAAQKLVPKLSRRCKVSKSRHKQVRGQGKLFEDA